MFGQKYPLQPHGQQLAHEFWCRWRREYLPTLTTRRKWTADAENLRPGELVLTAEENTPRGMWIMARVVKPITGTDGRVRAAVVKTAYGEVARPAVRPCVLCVCHLLTGASRWPWDV